MSPGYRPDVDFEGGERAADRRAAGAQAPGPDRRLPRLERRRPGCKPGRLAPPASLAGTEVRRHRSRGLRRLPDDPARRLARRGADAPHRLARERVVCGCHPGCRPRRRAAARRRAELPLAHLQRPRGGSGEGARRRARRHAGRPARRRPAHQARPGHRVGERPVARRGARARALAVRGPHRHRRRAARRVPGGRASVRQPLVGGAALRLPRSEPACREGAVRAARRTARHRDRPRRAARGREDLCGAGERGRRLRRRDGSVRGGPRASRRHDRGSDRRGRPADRRVARGRADPVPARAGAGPGRRR